MALTMRIMGPKEVGVMPGFDFFPGEDRVLKLQLFERDNDDAWEIPNGAIKMLELPGFPDDLVFEDADITVDDEDPSMFSINLSDTQTKILISGDIRFTYQDGDITRIATLEAALKRMTSALG